MESFKSVPFLVFLSFCFFKIYSANTVSLCELVDGVERGGKCYYFTNERKYQGQGVEKCLSKISSEWPVNNFNITYPILADSLNSSELVDLFNNLKTVSAKNSAVYHAFTGYRWNGDYVVDFNNRTLDYDRHEDLVRKHFERNHCSTVNKHGTINWVVCNTDSSTLCTCKESATVDIENTTSIGYLVDNLFNNTSYILTKKNRSQTVGYQICQDLNCTIFTLESEVDVSIIKAVLAEAPVDTDEFDKAFIGYMGNKKQITSIDGSAINDDVMEYLNDTIGHCLKVQATLIQITPCDNQKYGLCEVENVLLPVETYSSTPEVVTVQNTILSTKPDDNASQNTTAPGYELQAVCYCNCYDDVENRTLTERIEIRRQDLIIERPELSRFTREKRCAENEKKSSTLIGVTAVLVIISVILVVIISDAVVIYQYFTRR